MIYGLLKLTITPKKGVLVIRLFVCLSIYLFVCLCVSRIIQILPQNSFHKKEGRSWSNLYPIKFWDFTYYSMLWKCYSYMHFCIILLFPFTAILQFYSFITFSLLINDLSLLLNCLVLIIVLHLCITYNVSSIRNGVQFPWAVKFNKEWWTEKS